MMITVILALVFGANFYILFRLWHLIPPFPYVRPALVVFVVLAVGAFFAAFLLGKKLPSSLVSFLYTLGASWFFITMYLLMAFLLLDLLRLTRLLPLGQFMFGSWIGFGVLAAVMVLIFTGGYLNYRNKKRVEIDIELPQEKSIGQPFKIVAVSDLHLGYSIGKKEFAGWVERINAENPDIVLIAGDIVDNHVRPLLEQDMAAVFRQIKSTYGVFASPGNHEYIGGLPDALNFLERSGVTVLRDESVLVGGMVYLVGRDDRSNNRRKPLSALVEPLDPGRPVVLLDHQPYHLKEAEQNGITLQFSGHTHRGQVWPISWITDGMYEVSHGYERRGDTHFYVSSGLGIWGGKFRIGTRSEYVVIRLR